MTWRKALIALAIVVVAIIAGYRRPPGGESSVREWRELMGTRWSIEVVYDERDVEAHRALRAAFAEVERIEALMSEWRPESPVSAINAAAGGPAVAVPGELLAILRRATAYGDRSGGAFDITWRGMGSLWSFDETFRVPAAAEVEQARGRVDYRALRLEDSRAGLARPGMAIGLGGIAKGYAVDRAATVLTAAGFSDWLVAGAGDIRVSRSWKGTPWRVGIRDPRGGHRDMLGSLELSSGAVSTSGDYERFRIVDGVRYHHIIDPRTGWPARDSISVSVKAPSSEQADVLATAIFILGPREGLALARTEGVDALIIDASGKRHATGIYARMK